MSVARRSSNSGVQNLTMHLEYCRPYLQILRGDALQTARPTPQGPARESIRRADAQLQEGGVTGGTGATEGTEGNGIHKRRNGVNGDVTEKRRAVHPPGTPAFGRHDDEQKTANTNGTLTREPLVFTVFCLSSRAKRGPGGGCPRHVVNLSRALAG